MPKGKGQTIYGTSISTTTSNSNNIVAIGGGYGNQLIASGGYGNSISINGGHGNQITSVQGFTSSPYSSVIKPKINEDEVILDIKNSTAEIFDFTYTRIKYKINRFIDNGICIERELEPGEIKKAIDFKKNQEVLLEFDITDNNVERYGKKYVSNSLVAYQWENVVFPIVNGITTTIANDLVTVQPMGAPNGQLFYMDFVYNGTTLTTNGTETVTLNSHTTNNITKTYVDSCSGSYCTV